MSDFSQPPVRPTNGAAIISLIMGIVGLFTIITAPVAVIFGHMSLSQIAKTGEEGRGLAIAGLVMGYIVSGVIVFTILLFVLLILLAVAA